tara:strand:- start:55 stop:315 length:261 start_codon:yes stop_codon:yes gene_type:complete
MTLNSEQPHRRLREKEQQKASSTPWQERLQDGTNTHKDDKVPNTEELFAEPLERNFSDKRAELVLFDQEAELRPEGFNPVVAAGLP